MVFATIRFVSSVTMIQADAQDSHSEPEATPISAVIMMTNNDQGKPYLATCKQQLNKDKNQ